ncbi:Gfo/Idh/MocA family protein [Breznakiella homolactica]|uniref:Gfo/Idh/MocA family oxidoreductase n=1 Tax=Breznakiella homolactica TaxID=2798577 RepID=A0A7T7XLJ0_9SPIR|nr:Gfo/Idh/MocA family oxidoreductase [Breznakiella homolactica]QQO08619.1 Gfo/Idh/MocA family oxidoreductase [Breznakiella homolactica]
MKIAILGAGNIARKMALTAAKMDTVEACAVGARDAGRAKTFAEEFGIKKSYGSYEELVSDSEVDLVYVATPQSHHYNHMKLCLEHGKPVLCEKAFTANARQARDILDLGKQKKLLVAEAIWTRYMPMRKTLDETIASGIIGKVNALTANLGYPVFRKERLREPSLAGGALLDIGVYPVNFALMAFGGEIQKIDSSVVMTPEGVDAMENISLMYRDGRMASLHSTMVSVSDRRGLIFGEKGYIEVTNINNPARIAVYLYDGTDYTLAESHDMPPQITGFEYQVESCRKALESGWLECPEMPHSEIITVMELFDGLRKSWGMKYPMD